MRLGRRTAHRKLAVSGGHSFASVGPLTCGMQFSELHPYDHVGCRVATRLTARSTRPFLVRDAGDRDLSCGWHLAQQHHRALRNPVQHSEARAGARGVSGCDGKGTH